MQLYKSHTEDKQIMLEGRFTKFSALSVNLRVGIAQSAPETMNLLLKSCTIYNNISIISFYISHFTLHCMIANTGLLLESFHTAHK